MQIEWWPCLDPCARAVAPGAPRGPARGFAASSLAQRRAAAMRELFPLLSAWRAPPGYVDRVAAAYRDLADANDPIDLEARRRRIQRSLRAARSTGAGTEVLA
jgi:hypothetical protein